MLVITNLENNFILETKQYFISTYFMSYPDINDLQWLFSSNIELITNPRFCVQSFHRTSSIKYYVLDVGYA